MSIEWTFQAFYDLSRSFLGGSDGKESACNAGDPGFDPSFGRIPWRRDWLPTLVLLLGELHEQRSLAGLQYMGSQRAEHN